MMGGAARVVVADDDPDDLVRLRSILEVAGFRVSLAGDGRTALRRIRAERPRLALIDLTLPVVDGWGVLEALAGLDRGPRVIVMSDKTGDHHVGRVFELGASAYLAEPFSADALVRVCREVLARSAEQDERHRWESLGALISRRASG